MNSPVSLWVSTIAEREPGVFTSAPGAERLSDQAGRIRESFVDAAEQAPSGADPSWFAHQGYVAAAQGRAGAGHLAWERIARRYGDFLAKRRFAGHHIDERKVAYTLGFALGLTDLGKVSRADASQLVSGLVPRPQHRRPLYRSARFWLFTGLLAVFVISYVAAQEVEEPPYATVSEPLPGKLAAQVRTVAAPVSTAVLPNAAAQPAGCPTDVIPSTDPVAQIRALRAECRAQVATRLVLAASPADRARLVEGLAPISGEGVAEVIRRALGDGDSRVVEAAIGAVIARGDRQARQALLGLMRTGDKATRIAAAGALGVLGDKASGQVLVEGLHDPDPQVRIAVQAALSRLVGKDLGPKARPWRRVLEPSASDRD